MFHLHATGDLWDTGQEAAVCPAGCPRDTWPASRALLSLCASFFPASLPTVPRNFRPQDQQKTRRTLGGAARNWFHNSTGCRIDGVWMQMSVRPSVMDTPSQRLVVDLVFDFCSGFLGGDFFRLFSLEPSREESTRALGSPPKTSPEAIIFLFFCAKRTPPELSKK